MTYLMGERRIMKRDEEKYKELQRKARQKKEAEVCHDNMIPFISTKN